MFFFFVFVFFCCFFIYKNDKSIISKHEEKDVKKCESRSKKEKDKKREKILERYQIFPEEQKQTLLEYTNNYNLAHKKVTV